MVARCLSRLRTRGNPRLYRVEVESPDSCTNRLEGTARQLLRRLRTITITTGSVTQTGNASDRFADELTALFV